MTGLVAGRIAPDQAFWDGLPRLLGRYHRAYLVIEDELHPDRWRTGAPILATFYSDLLRDRAFVSVVVRFASAPRKQLVGLVGDPYDFVHNELVEQKIFRVLSDAGLHGVDASRRASQLRYAAKRHVRRSWGSGATHAELKRLERDLAGAVQSLGSVASDDETLRALVRRALDVAACAVVVEVLIATSGDLSITESWSEALVPALMMLGLRSGETTPPTSNRGW